MKSLLTLRKETEQNDPTDNYEFPKRGFVAVIEYDDPGLDNTPYRLYRYSKGAKGWIAEEVATAGTHHGDAIDWLYRTLVEDTSNQHELLHRSDTMSRYGVAYPLDTYQRPDGSRYARWDLTGSLTVRYGLLPGEDDGENGYDFVDPDGGPFIRVGYRRPFFRTDPDCPEYEEETGVVTHIHVDPDHQNIILLEIEPINQ